MVAKRILVFQTAFLGDACLSIPLLKNLREHFSGARLGLVCRQGVGEIFLSGGLVHECIEVDKKTGASLKSAFEQTKKFNADLIISPHRSFRTALWVRRLGVATTVGFRDWWTFFAYNKRKIRPDAEHDVLRQLSLLEKVGVKADQKREDLMSLKLELPENRKFSGIQNFVALSPGSQWNTKRWTKEGFIEVGKKMGDLGYALAIVGAPNECELCDEVAKSLPGSVNLCGQTTILELAQVLKGAKLLVCNDSGAMHVATVAGTPVVSIFGATVPAQGFTPWSKKARVVEVELGCRPCGAHGHDRCPLGHHHCMTTVTPEMVLGAAKGMIS